MRARAESPICESNAEARREDAPAPRAGLPKSLIVLLAGLAALAYRGVLLWDPGRPGLPDVTRFFFGWTDTSPQLLFGLTAFLLFSRRRLLGAARSDAGAPLAALPFLVAGSLLFAWGRHVGAGDVLLASLVLVALGAALLLFGGRFAARLLPPLVILAFAIPLPGVVSNQVFFSLQVSGAEHTARLLDAVGISAVSEGDLIQLLRGEFQVIESCSGLRAIQVLTMLAVGWACFFQVPLLHAALLVAAAPLIAYGVNLARIASLVLHGGSEHWLTHELQGVGAFLLGTLCLYAVDALLLRALPRTETRADEHRGGVGSAGNAAGGRRRAMALAAFLAALVALSVAVPRWEAPRSLPHRDLDLPDTIGGWHRAERLEPDRRFLGVVAFSRQAYALYTRGGEAVSVFVGYDDRLRRDRSLLSPKNGWPGRGWHVEEATHLELEPDGPRVEALQARSRQSRALSYFWYEGTRGVLSESVRAWLGLDQSSLRRPHEALVVRVSTPLGLGAEARARAAERLGDVARGLRPLLRRPPG